MTWDNRKRYKISLRKGDEGLGRRCPKWLMRSRKSWSGKTAIFISRVGHSSGRELDEIRFLEDFASQLIFSRISILIKKQLKIHLRKSTCIFACFRWAFFSKLEAARYLRRRTAEMSTSFDFLNKHFFERKSCSFSDNHQKEKCLFNSIDRVLEREIAELLAQRFFLSYCLEKF